MIGRAQHIGIGPQFGVVRILGLKHTHDRPLLIGQLQLLAHLHIAELGLRAFANHDFTQAGVELAALHDLDLRADRPALRAHTTELHIHIATIIAADQIDHLRQLR